VIEQKKCAECGGDIVVRYQISDRDFYIEDGEIKEDTNTYFEPTFVFHCIEDFEHDIMKDLTVDQINELEKWEENLLSILEEKFEI
jgi:hypothetical protein